MKSVDLIVIELREKLSNEKSFYVKRRDELKTAIKVLPKGHSIAIKALKEKLEPIEKSIENINDISNILFHWEDHLNCHNSD